MKPVVSIIMPVFNSEKFVEESILSVVMQTFVDWELWVINDGSLDQSEIIITKYVQLYKNVHYISLERNEGVAYARNVALEKVNGKYIAFLDSDDLWKPDKLKIQIERMESENLLFTYTAYELINENGQNFRKIIACPPEVTYRELLKSNTVGCLTVVYNVESLGKFEMPLLKKRQDYATWLNILKSGVVGVGIQNCLASYRIVSNSLSSNGLAVVKYNWKVLQLQKELNYFERIYFFIYFFMSKLFKYFKIRL